MNIQTKQNNMKKVFMVCSITDTSYYIDGEYIYTTALKEEAICETEIKAEEKIAEIIGSHYYRNEVYTILPTYSKA